MQSFKCRMKATAMLLLCVSCSVVCKADEAHSCTSMREWYPGIEPKPVTDKTPYKLIVTPLNGYGRAVYNPESVFNVTLIRSDKAGTFVGFMIYAKVQFPEDVSSYGYFMEPRPKGVEAVECKDGYKFEVARNSTSQEWTSVHLGWKAPPNNPVGKITFSANVAEAPGVFYEGFEVVLKYNCPMPSCYLPDGCPNGLARDKNDCINCECAGAGSIGLGLSSLLGVVFVFFYHLL